MDLIKAHIATSSDKEKDLQTHTIQHQLVSKPSLFQQFCVEAQRHHASETTKMHSDGFSSKSCDCRKLGHDRNPGKGAFSFGFAQSAEHDDHCPFYVAGMKQTRLHLSFTYCFRLISRSLHIVAGLTSGAGGSSICAQVDWIPIVSFDSSPAVQLLFQFRWTDIGESQPHVVLETTRTKLLRLFAEGQSHPRETDEQGRTLLQFANEAADWSRHSSDEYMTAFGRLLSSLATLGTKAPITSLVHETSYSSIGP